MAMRSSLATGGKRQGQIGIQYDRAVTIDTVQYGAPRTTRPTTSFESVLSGGGHPARLYDGCPEFQALAVYRRQRERPEQNPVDFPPVFRSSKRIDYIVVEAKNAGELGTLRTYDLGYDVIGTADRAHSLLTSVALKGRDPNLSLPPYTMATSKTPRPSLTGWPWRLFQTAMVEKRSLLQYSLFLQSRDENRYRKRVTRRDVYDGSQAVSQSTMPTRVEAGSRYYTTKYDGLYSEWYEFLGHSQVVETLTDRKSGSRSSRPSPISSQRRFNVDPIKDPKGYLQPRASSGPGQVLSRSIRANASDLSFTRSRTGGDAAGSPVHPIRRIHPECPLQTSHVGPAGGQD